VRLAQVYLQLGDPASAVIAAGLAKVRTFAKGDPGNSIYDVVSAELYENAGHGKEAVALLDKVAAAGPLDDDLTLALFRLYTRTDDRAKAESVIDARLKGDPKDFAIRSVLAGFYLEQKSVTAPSPNIRALSPNARLIRLR
jgi:predicted Zn-dependent protease